MKLLRQGFEILLDDTDFSALSNKGYRVCLIIDKKRKNKRDVALYCCHSRYVMTLAEFLFGSGFIVHKNNNLLDFRRDNCAVVDESTVRHRGLKIKASSGYRGVYCNHKKFNVHIKHLGKQIYLGRFESPIRAAIAHDKKVTELYGEYAILNFPNT